MENESLVGHEQYVGAASHNPLQRRQSDKARIVMGYLYLNSILYLAFAIWCTATPLKTAVNLGYLILSSGGQSEYLVIYGGLQIGISILFYLLARHSAHLRLGAKVAVGLYTPIVVYRLVTVLSHWPVGGLTLATGTLELFLLIGAVWSYATMRGDG